MSIFHLWLALLLRLSPALYLARYVSKSVILHQARFRAKEYIYLLKLALVDRVSLVLKLYLASLIMITSILRLAFLRFTKFQTKIKKGDLPKLSYAH